MAKAGAASLHAWTKIARQRIFDHLREPNMQHCNDIETRHSGKFYNSQNAEIPTKHI